MKLNNLVILSAIIIGIMLPYTFAVAGVQSATPPSVPWDSLSTAKGTLVQSLPLQASLGQVQIIFETTKLVDVQRALDKGHVARQGDAAGALSWLCYSIRGKTFTQRIWLTSNEMGGGRVNGLEVLQIPTSGPINSECPDIDARTTPLKLDRDLHLNSSYADVKAAWGAESERQGDWIVYAYDGKTKVSDTNFDVTGRIGVHLKRGRIDQISMFKITSN